MHRRLVLTALLGACAAPPALAPADLAELADQRTATLGAGTLTLTVRGVQSEAGVLGVSLHLSEDGFPSDHEAAWVGRRVPARDGTVLIFEDVPAGEFACSVYHDLDDNGALDTALLGIPAEPWGVTRGARGSFGPPSFDRAKLELAAGESLEIEVEVHE